MKKLLVLGLLLVYGATSFGVSLNLHYCCGTLQEVSFSNASDHDCAGMPSDNKDSFSNRCCQDQQVSISLHSDQSQSRHILNFLQIGEAVPAKLFPIVKASPLQPANNYYVLCNSPPGSTIPLFIKNCIFRI